MSGWRLSAAAALLSTVAGCGVAAEPAVADGLGGELTVFAAASLKEAFGQIETELEVDSNRVRQVWSVQIADNGVRVFSGTRTTVAPSGSFSVEQLIANRAGTDRITATARTTSTGETCAATVVYPG